MTRNFDLEVNKMYLNTQSVKDTNDILWEEINRWIPHKVKPKEKRSIKFNSWQVNTFSCGSVNYLMNCVAETSQCENWTLLPAKVKSK